jgi:uridine kinase
VEGLFALTDSVLRRTFHLKIFVDVPAEIRLARKLQRDVDVRGEGVKEVVDHFFQNCEPMHLEHVNPTKSYADLTVSNETQLSAAVEQLRQVIIRAGAEFLGHKIE